MKSVFVRLAILFLLPITALAQKTQSPSALKQMVETEQAFSKTAEVKNTREAFMAFIADDGLLWRPRAVNGKKWMNEHPVPPSDKRPLLAWQPAFAQMAEAGDLGFTTGPWEFKSDINDAKPSGYGHFVTVWKKQTDGSWKFLADLGISHPQSGGPLDIWQVDNKATSKSVKEVDVAKVTESLLERDRSYAAAGLKSGLSSAFLTHAASDARLYLPENLPIIGRAGAVHMLATMKDPVAYQTIAGDVSRSGDLGFTHGTYEKASAADAKKTTERGNYLRIWKKHGATWQIVLDVTNPIP